MILIVSLFYGLDGLFGTHVRMDDCVVYPLPFHDPTCSRNVDRCQLLSFPTPCISLPVPPRFRFLALHFSPFSSVATFVVGTIIPATSLTKEDKEASVYGQMRARTYQFPEDH